MCNGRTCSLLLQLLSTSLGLYPVKTGSAPTHYTSPHRTSIDAHLSDQQSALSYADLIAAAPTPSMSTPAQPSITHLAAPFLYLVDLLQCCTAHCSALIASGCISRTLQLIPEMSVLRLQLSPVSIQVVPNELLVLHTLQVSVRDVTFGWAAA